LTLVSAQRPQDLVFTLFGEYLLERGEPVWVGSLIALLEPFGLSAGAVRTVLSRMAKKGWLTGRRRGRHSFYALTPRGRRLLKEGQARIFHPSWDRPWNGSWLLLAYSIPQDARTLRDRLRDRLAWLGFGSLGNGLWISPHDVTAQIEELSTQMRLGDQLVCFRAERVGGADDLTLVERCWDLTALDRRYRTFVEKWGPVARDVGSVGQPKATATPTATSFAIRFELIHEFRSFPLEDPYLPRALLPGVWAGDEASRLFLDLHDRLVGPADDYVDEVLADAPQPTVPA
jgi:phenylacetic acid degradation operon negative regulatory protein